MKQEIVAFYGDQHRFDPDEQRPEVWRYGEREILLLRPREAESDEPREFHVKDGGGIQPRLSRTYTSLPRDPEKRRYGPSSMRLVGWQVDDRLLGTAVAFSDSSEDHLPGYETLATMENREVKILSGRLEYLGDPKLERLFNAPRRSTSRGDSAGGGAKRFIAQDRETGLYRREDGHWTENPYEAECYETPSDAEVDLWTILESIRIVPLPPVTEEA